MTFAVFAHLFSTLLDLLGLLARSDHEKDVEILLLRHQLRILQRTRARPPRLSWWDKLPLALLAAKLVQEAKSIPVFGSAKVCSCSLLRRCYGGTVNWCGASGPSNTDQLQGGHALRPNSKR